VSATLRRIGLPEIVLLAAFVVDMAIVLQAAFDDAGPKGVDLVQLPGIAGMCGCALWARGRPAAAAFAGALTLAASTVLIRLAHAEPYSTVLAYVSFAEVVAGVLLVYYAVRQLRPGIAFAAVSSLVVGCLLAVGGRSHHAGFGDGPFIQSLVLGLGLLIAAVVFGLQGRKPTPGHTRNKVVDLLRAQWPVVGGLSLLLFFELADSFDRGPRTFPVVLFSIASAGMAVLAGRHPVRAAVGLAVLFPVSAAVSKLMVRGLSGGYPTVGGLTPAQVGAGMVVVAYLVRLVPAARARVAVAPLIVVVAFAALINGQRNQTITGLSTLRELFVGACLLLGISVAIGMFLRSRDSERTQAMQSAVTDAQTAERMALARELHDVVAHHVTGIVVQAQAARMMGERDPKIALDAMGRIEDAGTEAMVAMRRLVRSMRGDAPVGSTEFSEQATTDLAADLRRLTETANVRVPTEVELDLPRTVPQEVARSALRLVQEALTNVGKHAAGATGATVLAEVRDGQLHLWVRDDGRGTDARPAGGSGGYGLIGMRERVELLHGTLTAGPAPGGGWRVEAWLPLEGDS
jgi:signal transduction histidine kinase